MKKQGFLISFDGTDSSGKATQTRQLAERLRFQGFPVLNLQSPDYTTPSGQKLKALFQHPDEWHTVPWHEKMRLFADNRAEHQEEVIAALGRGDIVIYDRYVPSSMAFITVEALLHDRTADRIAVQKQVMELEYDTNHMPHENISIFLDVPPLISSTLLEKRKVKLQDKDEYTDHIEVQQRLYNEYDLLCHQDPHHYVRVSCVVGDELLGVTDIGELVWEQLVVRFPDIKKR